MSIWDLPDQQNYVLFEGAGATGAAHEWVVPSGIRTLRCLGCGGGGGGGGGATNGGGGGGGGTAPSYWIDLPVEPGDVLTITVGAGGAGGGPDTNGAYGSDTTITIGGTLRAVWWRGVYGDKGGASAGGDFNGAARVYSKWFYTSPNTEYTQFGPYTGYVCTGSNGNAPGATNGIRVRSTNVYFRSGVTAGSPDACGGVPGINALWRNPTTSGIAAGGMSDVSGGNAPAVDTLGLITLFGEANKPYGIGGGGGAGGANPGTGAGGWSGVVVIWY